MTATRGLVVNRISPTGRLEDIPIVQVTVMEVATAVETALGSSLEELQSQSRARETLENRQIAMYLMRTDAHGSFPEIGILLKRDHSTVMHGVGGIREKLTSNHPEVVRKVDLVRSCYPFFGHTPTPEELARMPFSRAVILSALTGIEGDELIYRVGEISPLAKAVVIQEIGSFLLFVDGRLRLEDIAQVLEIPIAEVHDNCQRIDRDLGLNEALARTVGSIRRRYKS